MVDASGGAALDVAQALHAQALDALERYQPEAADALLASAVDVLDTQPLPVLDPAVLEIRVRVILTQAWVAFERAGIGAATPSLDEAFALARALGRPDLETRCYLQGATMRARSGDLTAAHRWMRQASVGLDVLPTPDQARVHLNRGVLASQLMMLDEAAADLATAARLAAVADAGQIAFMARHNAGYVDFLRGDLPAALESMRLADAMTVDVNRSVSQLDRARVLLEAGLLDDAAAALRSAHTLASADGIGQDLAEIDLDLARAALLLGDPLGAAGHASTAQRRFRDRRAESWSRRAELVELEASAYAAHALARTVRHALRLADTAHRHGEKHVARRAALVAADAIAHRDRISARERTVAEAAYSLASPLTRSPSLATRLHVRYVGARLALPARPDRASRLLGSAAADLVAVAQRTSSLDLRTALAVHSARLATLDIGLGMATGRADAVFRRTERWRAVSDRVPVVRPPHNPAAADLLTQLRRIHEDLREATGRDHEALTGRAADLERQVRALDWGTPGSPTGSAAVASRDSTSPLATATYGQALSVCRATGTTLVSYFVHDEIVHAVVISPDDRPQGRVIPLATSGEVRETLGRARADTDAAALPMVGPIRGVVEDSLRATLARLDGLVGGAAVVAALHGGGRRRGPAHPALGDRVTLVPSRLLSGLPWGMLPSLRGVPLTVARSATAWVTTARHTAVVDPIVTALAGPDLAHADDEVASVARTWGGLSMPAAASTQLALTRALTTADIVHIAAHGRHHHQSPLFSTIRLGDGVVFAHELPPAGIRASHVVLSACDVGRGTIRPGDESLGLTAVLLSLGVQSVVASANRVPDDVAVAAMTAYHSRLRDGQPSDVALAGATAELPLAARAFMTFGTPWAAAEAR